jgi:hypothetical protein
MDLVQWDFQRLGPISIIFEVNGNIYVGRDTCVIHQIDTQTNSCVAHSIFLQYQNLITIAKYQGKLYAAGDTGPCVFMKIWLNICENFSLEFSFRF